MIAFKMYTKWKYIFANHLNCRAIFQKRFSIGLSILVDFEQILAYTQRATE